jgi:transposase
MHIRVTKIRQNGRIYRYAQLVESYRRKPDGMPTKRVLTNLGQLSDAEIENWRVNLAACRDGKRVVVGTPAKPAKPEANLQYLDIAVLLELWRQSGLERICRELLTEGEAAVHPADVVAALTIHRCVEPRSKLQATRWFGRTALPELLEFPADDFGNTRLHRVLEQLAEQTSPLMRCLPSLYLDEPSSAFSVLYVDISDATFEGKGPELAQKGRTKRDTIQQQVGIVLMCNERGYPVRWKVIAGNTAEAPELIEQMRLASGTTWGKRVPIIGDRALGRSQYIQEMLGADIHFITAMGRNEFPSYAPELFRGPFEERDIEETIEHLLQHGFERVQDDLLVRDLGITTPRKGNQAPRQRSLLDLTDPSKDALERAQVIIEAVRSGAAASQNQAIENLGYSITSAKVWMKLLKLTPELQADVLSGAATCLPIRRLLNIAQLKVDQQRAAFDDLVALREAGALRARPSKTPRRAELEPSSTLRVRTALYFNSEIFAHQRATARKQLKQVEALVKTLNSSAVLGLRSQKELLVAVDRKLNRLHLSQAFNVSTFTLQGEERQIPQLRVEINAGNWNQRRSRDGFSLLVAHPHVTLPAVELCRLYRSKDTVEKDFQTIKSVVRMLPVRHRTDNKVVAHVTLCVLALLLERLLRDRLDGRLSAERALETLATCHLNRYGDSKKERAYLITRTSDEQKKLLRSIGLEHLSSDDQMIEMIHPM